MECRLAQFKRHLFSTGVQTHAREFAECSALECRNFWEVTSNNDFSTMGLPVAHAPIAISNFGTCVYGNGR